MYVCMYLTLSVVTRFIAVVQLRNVTCWCSALLISGHLLCWSWYRHHGRRCVETPCEASAVFCNIKLTSLYLSNDRFLSYL